MFSLSEILGPQTPVINILDIGAMLEGAPRYAPIFEAGNTRLTLVEPNEKETAPLRQAFGDETRLLDCFLGDGKPAKLNITHYPGCTSVFTPDPAVIDVFSSIDTGPGSNFEVIETAPVETTRLDDITPEVDADYIKIDVQGSELKILENGLKALASVSVIETEVEFLAIYQDQPLFGDLQIFMRDQGFVLHKFIDVASRCFHPMSFNDNKYAGMSQLLWADAIFVRDFSALENYTDAALLKTAYIMHDLYRSFDFVFFLLSEHAKRQHTSYALTYAKRLASLPELPKLMLNLKEHT